MKLSRRISILAIAGAIGLSAQPAAPSVDAVIDAYVKATGGAEAMKKVTSRYGKGTMEIAAMGMKATMEMYAKAPNKMLMKVDMPGMGLVQEGFDGAVAWSFNPAQGMREKSGVELALTKRNAELHKELKLKELYAKIEMAGTEKINNKDAYHLVATPLEGAPEHWYIDKATSHLVRSTMELEGPMGKMNVVTDMEDYRDVEGMKVAWTLRQQAGPIGVVMKFEEMKMNVPIDDAVFKKPATP